MGQKPVFLPSSLEAAAISESLLVLEVSHESFLQDASFVGCLKSTSFE